MRNIILILILGLIVVSCDNNQKQPPMANNGVLDLRNWDFEKDGIVRLDGEWEFYWKQFLKSADFDTVRKKQYMFVAGSWRGKKWNGKELGGHGYASYKLKVILPNQYGKIALKVPDQGTAFEFYLNDTLLCKNGKIGKTKETSIPQYLPQIVTYDYNTDTLEVLAIVSNYHFWLGGLEFSINMGNENTIRRVNEMNGFSDLFFVGICFLCFIVFLNYFIFRSKEKSFLYFSLFNFLIIIRTFTVGEKTLISIFPNIDYELLIKLEGMSWMIAVSCVSFYIYELFKNEYPKIIRNAIALIFLIYAFITLITPAEINSNLILIGQLNMVVVMLIFLFICIKGIVNHREGAILCTIGLTIQVISNTNEILYYNYLAPNILNGTIGIFVWSITQITLLSKRFSSAFKRVENYAKDLEIEVEEKTKDLRAEKEKSDRLLLNVLPEQIAERLKAGEVPIADHFEEASVVFIDIVDFTKKSAGTNPKEIVEILNVLYSRLDVIAKKHGLEKIKTIGDCYMAASGIPIADKDHANKAAKFAIDAMSALKDYDTGKGTILNFRCGIDCGQVVAGVIGENKFIYDIWSDMVNTASRMETNGVVGKIQCTSRFRDKLLITNDQLSIGFEDRGEIEIKGKGMMKTYFINK